MRRARARLLESEITGRLRKYDGATAGRRAGGWMAMSTSANAELKGALHLLRDRSRELVRNNTYAARAVDVIVSNTIGTGIIPQVKDRASSRAKKFQDAWARWGESTECDVTGQHDIYGLQALAMRTLVESGELLVRRVWTPGQTVPMKLQIIEPDHIDSSREGTTLTPDMVTVQGIDYDQYGRPTGVWLYPQHPGDNSIGRRFSIKSQLFKMDDLIHPFRVDRPGQGRGVPWASVAMLRMKDFDEFIDATIVKQKVSASFAGFVKEPDGVSMDVNGKTLAISEKIEPGAIEILPPGKDIVFPNPPSVNEFGGFTQEVLHSIAVGFGVTYESLTGDYSRVNFSSGRMGHIEFQRNIDTWRWRIMIPQFCKPVFGWFTQAAIIAGVDTMAPGSVSWTAPRREMIDPSKEYASIVTAVRSGLMSLSEALRSLGYDPDEVLEEIAADNDKSDKLKLILDSDPRKVMKAGIVQPYVSNSEGDDQEPAAEAPAGGARYFVDENEQLFKQNEDGSIEKVR